MLLIPLSITPLAFAQDDEDDEESEDPWGEASIDHELNVPWEYPSDYIAQPLNYSKRVTEFAFGFSQKYSRHYYDDSGDLVEGSFKTKKQVFSLYLGMGWTDNWTVAVTFPFVYKKTKLFEGSNNYRLGRDNTYGYLFEEAVFDFFDNHELWRLWEADLPQLGDLHLYNAYSVFRKLEPYTTSIVIELDVKFPTGNDNPRRTAEVRNFITDGNTDSLLGIGIKQQAWKFAFEFHGGYNIRWPANTKYSAGTVDFADQLKADGEIVFQIPETQPLWDAINIGATAHYMIRPDIDAIKIAGRKPFSTYIKDKNGNEVEVGDSPANMLSVGPTVVYQAPIGWITHVFNEIHFNMDIPVMGENTFLSTTKSYMMPPYELESYEGVGITYSFKLLKRWQ
jgi:hypothetical protein